MKKVMLAICVCALGCSFWSAIASIVPKSHEGRITTRASKALEDFRKPAREAKEVVPGFLWIEAEDFANYGGWWIDTQYVAFMGSAYLIAAGVCKPVEDAVSSAEIPKAGKYRLWVRAMNWNVEHTPGKFKVAINDQQSGHLFGTAPERAWLWENGGEFDLPAGRTALTLKDMTGAYGRCDALILTTDLNYVPPREAKALTQERARLTGASLTPKDVGEYDVVVVGGGTAGCCAAIASARKGAKTVLIQDRPVLGGNASIEMGVGSQGASSHKRNMREGGIIEEAFRIMNQKHHRMLSDSFADLMDAEKNLTVLLNERVDGVEMKDAAHIATVRMVNTLLGSVSRIKGQFFLDCTGDGWVGFYAGAEYRWGRESRDQTGEPLAVDKPDNVTMSGCIFGPHGMFFYAPKREAAVPFMPPPWIAKIPGPEDFGRTIKSPNSGNWWLEHEGAIDDLNDPEFARDELIRIVFAYWDFLKNRRTDKEESALYELTHVPIWNAKREGRRLIGDYVFNQMDAQTEPLLPDRISYGGWSLDIHHPKGIYSGKEGPYNYDAKTQLYGFPYRSLYSKNIENLFFAGRNVSVTHVALGTVRVESTLATFGQAAGTAASMCLRYKTTPRGIYEKHIKELQQTLLKDDQYIPGLVNEDPADLARHAKVTASSTAGYTSFDKSHYKVDTKRSRDERMHELLIPRIASLPIGLDNRVESIQVKLFSALSAPVDVQAYLCGTADTEKMADLATLTSATAKVKPGEQWATFSFKTNVVAPHVAIRFEPIKGVHWMLVSEAPNGAVRGYGGTAKAPWTCLPSQYYSMYTVPARKYAIDVAPEHVIDGVSRMLGTTNHFWCSDASLPLPQWIELDLGKAKTIHTVQLTFDTDFAMRWPGGPLSPRCVKDYEVLCSDGAGGWKTLATVKDNFQRHCVQSFTPVDTQKIRVQVQATHGDPSARIFEVRIY